METIRLDQTDSYQTQFEAQVLSTRREGRQGVIILDATCFYPDSGGQPPDQGTLGSLPVVRVEEEEGVILHFLDAQAPFEVGQRIRGEVDWSRRFDHMQQHTGQHILSQAFLRETGFETESFHIGRDVSTIDLAATRLDPGFIYKTEDLANRIIFENRDIRARSVSQEEADRLHLRRRPDREGELRIIEIDDFDQTACGGTHCRRTGEVGLLKVRRWIRVRQKARVEFYCGHRALLDYRGKNRSLYQISKLLSRSEEELVTALEELLQRQKASQKENEDLKKEIAKLEAHILETRFHSFGTVELLIHIWDRKAPKELGTLARRMASEKPQRVILLGSKEPAPNLCVACSEDLAELDLQSRAPDLAALLDGRGGGSASFIQVGGSREQGLNEAPDLVKSWIVEDAPPA